MKGEAAATWFGCTVAQRRGRPSPAANLRGPVYLQRMHDPLRPTFEHVVRGVTPEEAVARLAAALGERESGLPHRRAGRHFMVWLPEARRHTWSPWLHLDCNEVAGEPRATELFGRFSPAPSLWTGVMLTYLALATVAAGGGLFGYSQWLVGESPWGLWLVAGALVAAFLILLSSRAGQTLARAQMSELVEAVELALPDAARVAVEAETHAAPVTSS